MKPLGVYEDLERSFLFSPWTAGLASGVAYPRLNSARFCLTHSDNNFPIMEALPTYLRGCIRKPQDPLIGSGSVSSSTKRVRSSSYGSVFVCTDTNNLVDVGGRVHYIRVYAIS